MKRAAQSKFFWCARSNEEETVWNVLVKPGKRVRTGDRIYFAKHLRAEVLAQGEFGERTIRFSADRRCANYWRSWEKLRCRPISIDRARTADRERYQTVFARERGSVAAPTAGLHFTPEMLEACRGAGAEIAYVTLHVGLGTFAPVRENDVADIQLHEEYFEISEANAEILRRAKRLLCVGTTSVRTIETALLRGGLNAMSGETNLFIHPGFRFRGTGAMLTNFHLPQSSLLMLACAFGRARSHAQGLPACGGSKDTVSFRTATACLWSSEILLVAGQAVGDVGLQSAEAVESSARIIEQAAPDARDVEHVVDRALSNRREPNRWR